MLCTAAFLGVFIHQGLREVPLSSSASFDFHSYFLPRFYLGAQQLSHGTVPLWNPYEYGGIPLLATTQPAALYPPTVAFFSLFSPATANWVWIVFHFAVLGVVFLFFLRDEGIEGLPAYAGASAWVFQSLTMSSNYSPIRIANTIFIPLVLLFANRTIERRSFGAFASLSLCIGLQLLAGYPEFFFDEAFILVVHAAVCWKVKRWALPPWKSLPILAAGFALGALAAGAQVVPLAELAVASRRSQVAGVARLLPINWNEWLICIAPGLLVFVGLGVFVRKARPATAGLILCWFVSVGGWLLLRALPGFSYIRFPIVWILFAGHFAAWMVALSVAALVQDASGGRRRKVVLAVFGASSLALAVLYGDSAAQILAGRTTSNFALYLGTAPAALAGLAGTALFVVAAALASRKRTPPALWYAATTLVIVSHAAAYPFGKTPAPFERPAGVGLAARLHGDPAVVTGRVLSLEDLRYGYEITDRLRSPLGVEYSFLPWRARRVQEKLEFIVFFAAINWEKVVAARGFLDAMDVQYIVGRASESALLAAAKFVPFRRSGPHTMLENDRHLGHAWVNYAVRNARTSEAALDFVLSPEFDPHDFVVLEKPTVRHYALTSGRRVTRPSAERRHSTYDVEFDVELPLPGIFVISEAPYPGWKAIVDGKEAPCLTADYLLKAVELDAGKHTVRFAYRPASVKIGFALSVLGILGIGALYCVGRRRRKRAPA